MEQMGPLAPIGLVILAIVVVVVTVLAFVGLFVVVILGATGILVLNDRAERKRRASEVEADEAW